MKERRRHRRYNLNAKVVVALRLLTESQLILLSVENISHSGLLVSGEASSYPLDTGMMIDVSLHLMRDTTDEKITFKAKVVEPRESNRFAMQIEEIDNHSRSLLDTYIASLQEDEDDLHD